MTVDMDRPLYEGGECGSTETKSGKPCRRWTYGPLCCLHRPPLSPDELARRAVMAEEAAAAQLVAWNRDPACWSWPIPERTEMPDFSGHRLEEELAAEWAWELIVAWQDGRCAGCGGPYSRMSGSVGDHCHMTGLVRGILCRGCNAKEGHGNGGWIEKYRRLPPAVILGVSCEHFGRGDSSVQFWVQLALREMRPKDSDPRGAAAFLADAANLPDKWEWFTYADEHGVDYAQFGLRHPRDIASELTDALAAGLTPRTFDRKDEAS